MYVKQRVWWGPLAFLFACTTGGFRDAGTDVLPDGDLDAVTLPDTTVEWPDVNADTNTCVNLECQIDSCGGHPENTTISGTVFAPNGTLPLYNVIVYVPNAPLSPLTPGVTCDQCGVIASGSPVTSVLSDAKGHFTITGAPSGTNIPLAMQVGKWRREIVIPEVDPCVDNHVGDVVNGVEQLTRLPRKHSEGDMPHIAITTGTCDHLACIMPKIGIDSSEFAPGPTSASQKPTAAVSFYSGGGATAPSGSPPAQPFWNDVNQLKNFDLAIFSCECHEPNDANVTSYQAVRQYLDSGGRIFTTDFMYVWYKDSPDTNLSSSPWQWPGGAPGGGHPIMIDYGFPKGQALSDWMYNVASIPPYKTQMLIQPPVKNSFESPVTFDNVWAINPKYGLEWSHSGPSNDPLNPPQHPRVITMNMPSAKSADSQCGKGVHIDLHVSTVDQIESDFPVGCTNEMHEPELVTTFFFFDVSSCIQDDTKPPEPPH